MYTDGLIEGRIGAGPERLGDERLVGMVEQKLGEHPDWRSNGRGLVASLIAEVEQLNGEPLTDDLAVMLLSAVHD